MAFNIDTSDYFQIYFLFENLLPREEERDTKISFVFWFIPQIIYMSLGRLKPGACSISQVSHLAAPAQTPGTFTAAFSSPDHKLNIWDSKRHPWVKPSLQAGALCIITIAPAPRQIILNTVFMCYHDSPV